MSRNCLEKRQGFKIHTDIFSVDKKTLCEGSLWSRTTARQKVLWGLTDYPSKDLYVKLLFQEQNDSRFPGEKAASAGERGSRDRRRNEGQWKHPMGLILSGSAAKLHFTSNFTKRPPEKCLCSFFSFSFLVIMKSQLPYQASNSCTIIMSSIHASLYRFLVLSPVCWRQSLCKSCWKDIWKIDQGFLKQSVK